MAKKKPKKPSKTATRGATARATKPPTKKGEPVAKRLKPRGPAPAKDRKGRRENRRHIPA